MKTKLNTCYTWGVGIGSTCLLSLVGGSVSGIPKVSKSVESAFLLVETLSSLGLSILSPIFHKTSLLCLLFCCDFLHLFLKKEVFGASRVKLARVFNNPKENELY